MRSPLLDWLDHPRADRGINFFVADDWETWSYERLASLVRRAAGGLLAAGVRAGDVVTIVERSSPQFVAALFGTMLAGATPSPIAPPFAFQDLAEYCEQVRGRLRQARPALIVAGSGLPEALAPVAAESGGPAVADLDEVLAGGRELPSHPQRAAHALLQFTSGTSERAKGVRISFGALEANVGAIGDWLRLTPTDGTASWLPIHHDMGLIGCLITPVAHGAPLWLMPPEEFLRSPLRLLECFGDGRACLTAMPCFALSYLARQVPAAALAGLDFRAWRALIVGAERVDPAVLDAFTRLVAPFGFQRRALLPAYGLAEATLAVTGLPLAEEWQAAAIDPDTLAVGRRVAPLEGPGAHRVVGCGRRLRDAGVAIHDERSQVVDEGVVGEIVVSGPSLAGGYADGFAAGPLDVGGRLRTGDAGFVLDGQLFVLGRLGDGLKVRGRHVFAEDIELALVTRGVPAHRVAAVLGQRSGLPTAVAVLERAEPAWVADAESILRRRAESASIVVVDAPRGTIQRTSSGKPRRRQLWTAFLEGSLSGTVLVDHPALSEQRGVHV